MYELSAATHTDQIKKFPSMTTMDAARSLRQVTALQQLARTLLELRISEFRQLASELHSDSKSVGTTPHEVQELVFQWATRTLESSQ